MTVALRSQQPVLLADRVSRLRPRVKDAYGVTTRSTSLTLDTATSPWGSAATRRMGRTRKRLGYRNSPTQPLTITTARCHPRAGCELLITRRMVLIRKRSLRHIEPVACPSAGKSRRTHRGSRTLIPLPHRSAFCLVSGHGAQRLPKLTMQIALFHASLPGSFRVQPVLKR